MMFHVVKIDVSQVQLIHDLVHQIYYPTYCNILSKDQIDFMLEQNYTVAALQKALLTGQDFYVLKFLDGTDLGFMALKDGSEDILRIEKLYLLPKVQGMGAGKFFISFANSIANESNKKFLELNVNRGNKAYYFYLKQGFKVTQEIDIPYYGYILDDYIMQKIV